MYEAYFGFSQRPFSAAPVANRYFPAASVDAARQALARCIERGAGAGLLIGPPGMGKSLLLQVLAAQFADKMAVVQLAGAQLASRRELLQAILFELRLPYRGLEEGEMRLALVDHLTRGDKCPQGMLLVVDEAQTLAKPLLEELRMMTNLARGGEPSVRLALAGSMELEEAFASPDLQAFSQRLAARCYLEPFDRSETLDYLRFQVAVAGGQAERVFHPGAMEAVHRATDGIPRLINQLCDHALLLAYQAERRPLDAKAIDVAWADLQQLPSPWQHEQADDARGAKGRQGIEFGSLNDDEAAPAAGRYPSDPETERIEVDFSADWPDDESPLDEADVRPDKSAPAATRRGTPSQPAPPAAAKVQGLRIVEDLERLQVVVDPYQSLEEEDDDETDAEATPPPAASAAPAARTGLSAAAAPTLWEDVIIPSPLAPTAGARLDHSQGSLEEEVVADRYAELDARRPRYSDPPSPAGLPQSPATRNAPRAQTFGPDRAGVAAPDFDEQVTLAEAMRLRLEAEGAAAVARVLSEPAPALPTASLRLAIEQAPPLPRAEDWLSASETMVLDPTQMPPSANVAGGMRGLESDIVLIDDEASATVPTAAEPPHRVERKDYRTLLAQLRNG